MTMCAMAIASALPVVIGAVTRSWTWLSARHCQQGNALFNHHYDTSEASYERGLIAQLKTKECFQAAVIRCPTLGFVQTKQSSELVQDTPEDTCQRCTPQTLQLYTIRIMRKSSLAVASCR